MPNERPLFKKGDLIIVTESFNGAPEGVVLKVITRSSGYYQCRVENSQINSQLFYVYYTKGGGSADTIVPADREVRAEYLQKKVEEMKEEIKKHERDIEILTKFDSEEAYVAHKLQIIFEAKNDPKAMTEALKELRNSHIL